MNNINADEWKHSEIVNVASITMHAAILAWTVILFTQIINME
jgi:hypothetical protein